MSDHVSRVCISDVTKQPRRAMDWAYVNPGEQVYFYADEGVTVVAGETAVYHGMAVVEVRGTGMFVARVVLYVGDVLYQRDNGIYEARRGSWPDVIELP